MYMRLCLVIVRGSCQMDSFWGCLSERMTDQYYWQARLLSGTMERDQPGTPTQEWVTCLVNLGNSAVRHFYSTWQKLNLLVLTVQVLHINGAPKSAVLLVSGLCHVDHHLFCGVMARTRVARQHLTANSFCANCINTEEFSRIISLCALIACHIVSNCSTFQVSSSLMVLIQKR